MNTMSVFEVALEKLFDCKLYLIKKLATSCSVSGCKR